jgi:hypothetical protein
MSSAQTNSVVLVIAVIAVGILLVVAISLIDSAFASKKAGLAKVCQTICQSHNEQAYKVTDALYQNPVCYCRASTGQIDTYTM